MKKVCVVGMGNMGSAISESLKKTGYFEMSGCDKGDDVSAYLSGCDIFVLAVKPQDFEELTESLKVDFEEKLCISIMAGVSIEKIRNKLGIDKIVRVMPNLPLKYEAAFSGWFCSEAVSVGERSAIKEILNSFGTEVEVDDESKIDAITALSGSGPAYYYYLNRSLKMKALDMGFSDEEARKIVRGTFLGAAKLLQEGGECSGELIDKITSKGGTTEAALEHLDSEKVDKSFADAVEAAYKRAKELND